MTNSKLRNKAIEEDRARYFREIEDSRRIQYTEAERVRHLRSDERSTQKVE